MEIWTYRRALMFLNELLIVSRVTGLRSMENRIAEEINYLTEIMAGKKHSIDTYAGEQVGNVCELLAREVVDQIADVWGAK